MPAKKPISITTRHNTKAEAAAKSAAESALSPQSRLSVAAPARLRGHTKAIGVWKRTIGLYLEIDGEIATAFDQDLLIKYCLLEEEASNLEKMRDQIHDDWEVNQKAAKKIKPSDDNLETWVKMWGVVNAMFQRFQGMDARLDGKRKLLLAIAQSLYLTPRSRAGVAPPEREAEAPKSAMGALLD